MTTEAILLPPEIDEWLGHLREIPDRHRTFDVDPGRAEAEFGIDEALASSLIDRGMPYESREGRCRFADVDLHYVGLRLGRATTYLTAMRLSADALASSSPHGWSTVGIRYVPHAAVGTDVEVLIPPGRRARTKIEPDRTAARVEVRIRSTWPGFDPAVHDILEYVGSLDFCLVPPPLDSDSGFVRRTRLASCASAAQLIVEECARLGIEARKSFGLLLACPFAAPRNWAEIRVRDLWVPADPLLLGTLSTYAGLDPEAWPPTRSPGAILVPLAAEQTQIVTADGRALSVSLVTNVTPA